MINKLGEIVICQTHVQCPYIAPYCAYGQVSFHNEKAIKKLKVERKVNEVLNRLEKTRTEVEKPDLEGEKEVSNKTAIILLTFFFLGSNHSWHGPGQGEKEVSNKTELFRQQSHLAWTRASGEGDEQQHGAI